MSTFRIRLGRAPGAWTGISGCLFSALFFLLVLSCIVGLAALILGAIRSTAVVQLALAKAQSHPQAVRALGEPLKLGWFITGSISTSGSSGQATLNVPISGARDRGILYLVAYKSGGEWYFTQLVLETKTYANRINLLEE